MSEATEKPKDFKEWLTNFWYYNWKYVFLIAVLVSVIIAGTVSCMAEPNYDTSVLLACQQKGVYEQSPLVQALMEKLGTYGNDTNGDGKVLIRPDIADSSTNVFNNVDMAWYTRLSSELQLGDSQFFLLDSSVFEYLLSQNGYLDLTERYPDYDIPMIYAVPLRDTPLYNIEFGLPEDGLPADADPQAYYDEQHAILDDLYIVFRFDNGVKPERRADQLVILDRLMEDSFN